MGSIYAADDDTDLDDSDDDLELAEDIDDIDLDDSDDDLELAEDIDDIDLDDSDDDLELAEDIDDIDLEDDEADDNQDDDSDDEADDNQDDDSDDEVDNQDDEDFNESEYALSDFEFLKYKITHYLYRYGNCSDYNWSESIEFLNEYQIYLSNSSNYTLNESSEGYNTYLKIYDSITSTFKDYNLTENETDYLKFMVIFYLNHYGNVSANYTWNESESFENYTPPLYLLGAFYKSLDACNGFECSKYLALNHLNYFPIANNNDVNLTLSGEDNTTAVEVPDNDSWWTNIIMIILVLMLVVLIIL